MKRCCQKTRAIPFCSRHVSNHAFMHTIKDTEQLSCCSIRGRRQLRLRCTKWPSASRGAFFGKGNASSSAQSSDNMQMRLRQDRKEPVVLVFGPIGKPKLDRTRSFVQLVIVRVQVRCPVAHLAKKGQSEGLSGIHAFRYPIATISNVKNTLRGETCISTPSSSSSRPIMSFRIADCMMPLQ